MENNDERPGKRGQKLYYYLSRLDAQELKDFHAYLNSPLLGNSPQMGRMLLVIQERVLAAGRTTIDADLFEAEFFPGEQLDEGKRKYIRIRIVQMHRKVLDFVAFQEYRKDVNAQHLNLLKSMYKRGWDKYFERTFEEIEAHEPVREFAEYDDYRFRRAVVMNEFLASQNMPSPDLNLSNAHVHLDESFIRSKLRLGMAAKHTSIVRGEKIEVAFMQNVEAYVLANNFYNDPEIELFYELWQMFETYDIDIEKAISHFFRGLEIIRLHVPVDLLEGRDAAQSMATFCVFMTRKGIKGFRDPLKELIQIQINSGIVLRTGLISPRFYLSIVKTMIGIGEVDWAHGFVNEWRKRIFGESDELYYYYNLASVLYFKKEYDRVVELLYNRVHRYEIEEYALASRIFICRSLWEKNEFDWLKSNLEAFRLFLIRNHNISERGKEGHKMFVRLFGSLLDAKLSSPEKKTKKLKNIQSEIEKHGGKIRFTWLSGVIERELQLP